MVLFPGAFDETIQYIDIELVSGDKFNGVYQAAATIPQNSISGTWNSFVGRFKDIRVEQVNRAETVTFEVTGRDVATDEPLNVSWSIEPQEIDVTQADQVVTYTINVTDEWS